MPAPYPASKQGTVAEDRMSGFPMFFLEKKARIITSDPFALMEHLASTTLAGQKRSEVLAYIEQASDFYEAASAPRLGSKPLLYYYSFLNLEKVLLLLRGVEIASAAKHGISDPRANYRERFRLDGQIVSIVGKSKNKSELFPELIHTLGGDAKGPRKLGFLCLVSQIPAVHRTYTQITNSKNQFLPVAKIELLTKDSTAWARVTVRIKNSRDRELLRELKALSEFSSVLSQVASANAGEVWLETDSMACRGRGATPAFAKLGKKLRSAQLSSILTSEGYRYYFAATPEAEFLPPLAAATASIFYLGSITRYKPADFDKIRIGKFGWLCEEILATLPLQILYTFASEMAGVDVVKPMALVRPQ